MGAEAPAAHADGVLVAEDGGDEAVLDALDGERDDTHLRRRDVGADRSVDAQPWHAGQPRHGRPGELGLVGRDAVEADVAQPADGGGEGDGADDVRRPGFLTVGEVGPHDVVDGDGAHGATTGVVRRRPEGVASTDEGAGAEGRVHLVGRQDDEVEVARVAVGAHVDPTVGGELGGVDEDPRSRRMDLLGEPVHWRHDAGDVRRARDRQQRHPARVQGQQVVEVVLVEGAVGAGSDVDDPSAARHGRSFEWCSRTVVSTTASSGSGSEPARQLTASVVFFPKTTTSRSGSAPTNSPTMARACSYTSVLNRDL